MLPWEEKGKSREAWMVDQIASRVSETRGLRAVEFGSATGEITRELVARGFDVLGLDARAESIAQGQRNYKGARSRVVDVECIFPQDVGGPFDVIVHVGVLYHLLGPFEHILTLNRWGQHLLLDTHVSKNDLAELHRESFDKPRAGLRSASWWLPFHVLQGTLHHLWKTVELVNDRDERNGRRVTFWAEGPKND